MCSLGEPGQVCPGAPAFCLQEAANRPVINCTGGEHGGVQRGPAARWPGGRPGGVLPSGDRGGVPSRSRVLELTPSRKGDVLLPQCCVLWGLCLVRQGACPQVPRLMLAERLGGAFVCGPFLPFQALLGHQSPHASTSAHACARMHTWTQTCVRAQL